MFISALKDVPLKSRRIVLARELSIALGILLFFLLFGKYIVSFLNIDPTAMSVTGGIVLFLIALQMSFPPSNFQFSDGPDDDPVGGRAIHPEHGLVVFDATTAQTLDFIGSGGV